MSRRFYTLGKFCTLCKSRTIKLVRVINSARHINVFNIILTYGTDQLPVTIRKVKSLFRFFTPSIRTKYVEVYTGFVYVRASVRLSVHKHVLDKVLH